MTLKKRIFLVSAICIIFGGMLVSYKSFEINNQIRLQSENEKAVEISHWIAQSIEQKVTHLESSVSYLDASTIETLKRMGARYFAYAYSKDGAWKIKWKVLGDLDRKGILSEVDGISFDQLPAAKRSWGFNDSGEHILISPVELAGSHQLKNGFLIFGLNESFFSFIGSVDPSVSLVSVDKKTIYTKEKSSIQKYISEIGAVASAKVLDIGGESRVFSSFFSKSSQLWVTRAQMYSAASYFTSSIFSYFLLAIVLSMVFLVVIIQRFMFDIVEKQGASRLGSAFDILRAAGKGAVDRIGKRVDGESVLESSDDIHMEKDAIVESVKDFSSFLDDVVALERTTLSKQKISVKTQVEEGASVVCAPQHVTDFLRRLIANSVDSLKNESEKRIQIELVNLSNDYQLIYVDTRRSNYPTGDGASMFLQNESSLENIDGIIAYGTWLFGDSFKVAKDGFCISIDLQKTVETEDVAPIHIGDEDSSRIEIKDEDTINLDFEKVEKLSAVDTNAEDATPLSENFESQSIEDIVSSFEMKNFSFDNAVKSDDETLTTEIAAETPVDDKGMFEFNTGDFKIKIRSPKAKRDADVSS